MRFAHIDAGAIPAPIPVDSGTYGTQERVTGTELFSVSVARHPAEGRLAPHSHRRATAMVVLSGGYEERVAGAVRAVPSMGLVIKPAGAVHANRFGRHGARTILIEMEDEASTLLDGTTTLFRDASVFDSTPAADLVIRMLRELGRADDLTPLSIDALVLDWIAVTGKTKYGGRRVAPAWLDRVRDRLHAAGAGTPRLAELAREAGHHPIYVARAFRRHYGQSIGSYARRVRLARAARAIAETPHAALGRVAADAGYSDQSHLAHEFRARTGMSPSGWREAAAG